MKHKVGDKVRIKSKEWFDAQEKNEVGSVVLKDGFYINIEKSKYCGRCATIVNEEETYYDIDIDNCEWAWTDEMFEDSINEKMEQFLETATPESIMQDAKEFGCEVEDTIDWEQRRYEIAKCCLNIGLNTFNKPKDIAKYCVDLADEMIKQLKNK